MRHKVAGKKLGRTKNQRTALFKGLASSLILHEKITTTEAKAKAVKPMVEKMVTKARVSSIHSRRLLLKELGSENVVNKLLEVVGPQFKNRPGGYLRIVRLGSRSGDQAKLVSLMFVEDFSSIATKKAAEEAELKPKTEKEKTAAKKNVEKKIKVSTKPKEDDGKAK